MFEGAITPGHLCVPEGEEDGWRIWTVRHDGRCGLLYVFQRFDIAERRADDIAHSLARSDADRTARGLPCSGVRAVTVAWDVWVIRHGETRPLVLAIPMTVPRPRTLISAVKLIGLQSD